MLTINRLTSSALFVVFLFSPALAQENRAPVETPREPIAPITSAAPLVTAAASAERVRFVSPGTVVQLRLEIYNEAGQKVFDTELRGGNVLDWHVQDGAGERLPSGSYACVLTTKSLSGRLSQRVGVVTVDDKNAAIKAAEAGELSLAQQQTVGPVEGNAAFTVLQREAEAITAVTHDGSDGQLTSTAGALTFRTGDLFSGKDAERLRITPAGDVGIGKDKPTAKLDVAGDIRASGTVRASEGVEFADGSRLSSSDGKLVHTDPGGEPQVTLDGTGTTGRLAKWTNGPAGTLGNSVVTEATSGKLGIGTVNPNYEITLFGNDVGLQLITPGTGVTPNDGFRFGIDSTNKAFLWNAEATDMYFGTTTTERMRIKATGDVGIGTNNPGAKLHVAGTVDFTGLRTQANGNVLLAPSGGSVGLGTSPVVSGHHALYVANDGGSESNNFRFDGFEDNLYIVAHSFPGSTIGAGVVFRTAKAGGNESDRMAITPAGNVGIGISDPTSVLHVIGSQPPPSVQTHGTPATEVLRVVGGTGGEASFGGTGGSVLIQGGVGGTGNGLAGGFGGSITLQPGEGGPGPGPGTNGSPGNVLLAPVGGSVGIGLATNLLSPTTHALYIGNDGGDVNNVFRLDGALNNLYIIANSRLQSASGAGIVFRTATAAGGETDRMAISPAGDVGVGTNSPGVKFQVVGGDAAVTSPGNGLILRATDGLNCFRLTVNDAGALSTVLVVCPP